MTLTPEAERLLRIHDGNIKQRLTVQHAIEQGWAAPAGTRLPVLPEANPNARHYPGRKPGTGKWQRVVAAWFHAAKPGAKVDRHALRMPDIGPFRPWVKAGKLRYVRGGGGGNFSYFEKL